MKYPRRAWWAFASSGALALGSACAPPMAPQSPASSGEPPVIDAGARAAAIGRAKEEARGWLAAADPRLAQRLHTRAPDDVIKQVGLEGVLSEDASAQIHDGSLDLFAFRARAKALEHAANVLKAAFGGDEAALARDPLARLVDEERARATDEAELDEAAGELVRGILSTWTPPASPREWPERDRWVSRHLLEIRESLRSDRPRTGPNDLEDALYPLERLLSPLEFPHGAAALAELRIAVDADGRPVPAVATNEKLARAVRVHLGLELDAAQLRPRLEALEATLYRRAREALVSAGPSAPEMQAAARKALFQPGACDAPPERVAICGLMSALADQPEAARLALMHDDVLLALAAVSPAPPPRTRLICAPDDDVVGALERSSLERPVVALGVALAIELMVRNDDVDGLSGWLGDAPLDFVERAFDARRQSAPARPGALHLETLATSAAPRSN